jgi:hypothetical protein
VGLLGTHLQPSQWFGLLVVVVSVTALGLRERTRQPVVQVEPAAAA